MNTAGGHAVNYKLSREAMSASASVKVLGVTIFQGDSDTAPLKWGSGLQHAAGRTSVWQRQIGTDYSVSVSNIHPSGPA